VANRVPILALAVVAASDSTVAVIFADADAVAEVVEAMAAPAPISDIWDREGE